MRQILPLLLLAPVLALFCQCDSHAPASIDGYGDEYPMTSEVAALMDSSMGYMDVDPQLAHRMLDSMREARLLSPQRSDYLHAMVLYGGEDRYDSALVICNRLLDENSWGDDRFIEEEVCVLASGITSGLSRLTETLKYANRGIALCHGDERMCYDEATLMSRVGMVEQQLGHKDAALATFAKAHDLLSQNHSFGSLVARISLMRKQANLHFEAKEYDQAIAVCLQVIELVQRFDRDPSMVEPRPQSMRESSPATRGFADLYECQMYRNIAHAYRLKVAHGLTSDRTADTDSVDCYIEKWSQTTESRTPESMASVLSELFFTGRKTLFAEAKEAAGLLYQGDTLVSEYVDYLGILAQDAASGHDYRASNAYLQRALAVSDSLRQRDMVNRLTEQMSINMVQEERLARVDAENLVERQQLIILLLSIGLAILLAGAGIIMVLLRKNREKEQIIELSQQDLAEAKEEIMELTKELEESIPEKTNSNAMLLYDRITKVMNEKKLYLNPDLDVKTMAVETCSSRTLISVCINSITGKGFRQWLAEYRLELIVDKMKEFPDKTIEELMLSCGYKDKSTFWRQFKAKYGMTAGEYRKQVLGQATLNSYAPDQSATD